MTGRRQTGLAESVDHQRWQALPSRFVGRGSTSAYAFGTSAAVMNPLDGTPEPSTSGAGFVQDPSGLRQSVRTRGVYPEVLEWGMGKKSCTISVSETTLAVTATGSNCVAA